MLRFKTEVRFHHLTAIAVALAVVNEVFGTFGADAWVTSANDGKHKTDSFHYANSALDFRIHHVPAEKREALVAALKARLEPQFDVLWEYVGTPQEHVHIEYEPKDT